MEARTLADAAAFLDDAEAFLLEDEARHNLILGLARTVRDSPSLYPERSFWVVREEDGVVAAALQTPPHNLVLGRPQGEPALDVLVGVVGHALPGVVGATPEVDGFTERWTRRYDRTARLVRGQGLYSLTSVQTVPTPPGEPRTATRDDLPLLLEWWQAFLDEAVPEDERGAEATARAVEHRLDADGAGIVVWEDGAPVSFAAFGNPTPNGIRIGPVYTPPDLRGRGYATALVAEASAQLLRAGRRFCFLYTDLANPTANAIYERIGYVRVCDSKQVAFL